MVILLDNSPSMRAEDVPPSRLERALEIVGRFARNKPSQDRVGLVSFASGSLILSYLTEDSSNILYYLNYLKDDSSFNPGTNIGRAIENALTILSRDAELHPQVARKKRIFILISDGEDHGDELENAVRECYPTRYQDSHHWHWFPGRSSHSHRAGERAGPLRGRRERKQDIDPLR